MSILQKFRNPQGISSAIFAAINCRDLFIRSEYRNVMLERWRSFPKKPVFSI
jgi:hypothetical protein